MCNHPHINTKQISPSAREELAAKMRLEEIYRPELTALFSKILRDFKVVVAATGQAIDARNYRPEFEASLLTQYRRTQSFFEGRLIASLEKESKGIISGLKSLVSAALVAWRTTSAKKDSAQITNTNQMQMQEALAKARQQQAEEGRPQDNRSLAALAGAILGRLFKSRVNRIVVTETQAAAESTRNIEASAIAGKVPFPLQDTAAVPAVPPQKVSKKWRDTGDSNVRESHIIADSLPAIAEDGIFTLGPTRSKLRFPGDLLLGAAAEETVNCRCFADYELVRGA